MALITKNQNIFTVMFKIVPRKLPVLLIMKELVYFIISSPKTHYTQTGLGFKLTVK